MDKKQSLGFYVWEIASAHTMAYFFAGLFAVTFMNYKEHFASQILSMLMRPLDSPVVALGPGLQPIRGVIIAFVLLPFKEYLLEGRNSVFKIAWLIFGLSFLSTLGPAPGSFEGYIYTALPVQYHTLGIPETLIYITLFSTMVASWYKHPRKIWMVLSVVMTVLIMLMSILGFLKSMGILTA